MSQVIHLLGANAVGVKIQRCLLFHSPIEYNQNLKSTERIKMLIYLFNKYYIKFSVLHKKKIIMFKE